VADAVLYEGYVLYPYRRSAQKNRTRFQFGVLMPPPYRAVDEHEPSASQTECLMECPADAELDIGMRFLHLQRRTAQLIEPSTGAATDVDTLRVGEAEYSSWDEAVEREQHFHGCVADLLDTHTELLFEFGESVVTENLVGLDGEQAGRLLRRCEALAGAIVVRAERTAGPYGAIRLRVRVENRTEPRVPLRSRDDGLKYSLIAAHLLIGVAGGSFLSLTDPPEWASGEVAGCVNVGTWPVLAGPPECRDLMLSSPVILYDHPEVAPESAGDLYDATEIDEILTLRTLALTDEERQEARATDPRATRGPTPRCHRRPTMSWSPGSWSPEGAGSGCGRAPVPRTRKTSSSPGARRWSRRYCTTWTARCTWRSARSVTPSPSCSAIMAGSSTSPPTNSSPSRPSGGREHNDRQTHQGGADRGGPGADRPVAARHQALSRTARDVTRQNALCRAFPRPAGDHPCVVTHQLSSAPKQA